MTEASRVRIHYRRPPDREQIFDQAVVFEDDSVIVTLAESVSLECPIVIGDSVALERGSPVVWFTFPGAWHDIGLFHRADGTFTGVYANVLTPVDIDGRVWVTTDLFLDVWIEAGRSDARILDMDEFEQALEAGWIDGPTGARARREAQLLAESAGRGTWPPPVVEQWPLERARAAMVGEKPA